MDPGSMVSQLNVPPNENLDKVQRLNAFGPFVHGVWTNGRESVGNEESLSGRADFLVSEFVRTIEENFSREEIESFSLVDIGCYDGYLSFEIAKRLSLKKVVGVEPREKNIQKGEMVREFLGLECSVEYRRGDIDSLSDSSEQFDLVFCSGVFHHLSDIGGALKKLRGITKRAIFLDSQCYVHPSVGTPFHNWFHERNRRRIEPKDLIYRFIPSEFSLSGHKFESGYYDGSATSFSMVTVPSPEMLLMGLTESGFENGVIVSSPKDYQKAFKSKMRSDSRTVSVFAKVSETRDFASEIARYVENYEQSMLKTVVDDSIARKFELWLKNPEKKGFFLYLLTEKWSPNTQPLVNKLIGVYSSCKVIGEILASVKYKPFDKVALELAKWYLSKGRIDEASDLLEKVVNDLNADWRVAYRSFALLSLIAGYRGEEDRQQYYRSLCLEGNPGFPEKLLVSLDHLFDNVNSSGDADESAI